MNNKRDKSYPTILGLTIVMLIIAVLSVLLSRTLVAQMRKPAVTVVPTMVFPGATPTATQEPVPAPASISGLVWHDLCAVGGGAGDTPLVPSPGCVLASDGYRANGLVESDEPGLGGVLVQLGMGACPASGLAAATSSMNGVYAFAGLDAGTYCVSIDALHAENALLLPGGWTFPSVSERSSVAAYTVTVVEGERRSGINFGWDYQSLPLPEPVPTTPAPTATEPVATATPQPSQPTATQAPVSPTLDAGCTDKATFVKDVTIPDGTRLLPGQSFIKTWRLRNDGTCAWTKEYALVFVSGDHLGGPVSVPLAGPVAPGSTVEVSVMLTAPAGNGNYSGKWQLRNAEGKLFGIGKDANDPFWVKIIVGSAPQPTATPTPPAVTYWRGEYYTNRDLTGSPAVVRNDAEINFNWGGSAPSTSLPADGFSVRWTRHVPFQGGSYRFYVRSDDGVRV